MAPVLASLVTSRLMSSWSWRSPPQQPTVTCRCSRLFSLSGEPVGASITAGGDFTWTPSEAQGPGTYTFDVEVTDGVDTNSSRSPSPLVRSTLLRCWLRWSPAVDELTELAFTASATDVDVPVQSLSFSLSGEPAVRRSQLVVTSHGHRPKPRVPVSIRSTLSSSDGIDTDTETVTVTVGEVNVAPVLTHW